MLDMNELSIGLDLPGELRAILRRSDYYTFTYCHVDIDDDTVLLDLDGDPIAADLSDEALRRGKLRLVEELKEAGYETSVEDSDGSTLEMTVTI